MISWQHLLWLAINPCSQQIDREEHSDMKISRIGRTIATPPVLACGLLMSAWLMSATARAQDVPGIEICTAEKTMERRTSCLQSDVNFLQGTINKLNADHLQKLDAANRQ